MTREDIYSWDEIPEQMVIEAAESKDVTEDTVCFQNLLAAGKIYKNAGLTPIYVADNHTTMVAVYPEELVGYKYH